MNAFSAGIGLIAMALGNPSSPPSEPASEGAEGPPVPTPAAPQDDWDLTWTWKDGIRFQSANGQIKGKFGGRIQYDNSWLSLDDGLEAAGFSDADGTEFRRARIFLSMDLLDGYFMKAQYDFAGQDVDFNDVYVGRKDVVGTADLKVGHFKEPFSLSTLTSSKHNTFLERNLSSAFSPSRNSGAMVYDTAADDKVTWALGLFHGNADGGGTAAEDGGYALTARLTATPLYEDDGDRLVHVGLAYSLRDNDGARFRARPEIHLSDRLVDTGELDSTEVDLGNLEAAAVFGPLHGQAEYAMAEVGGSNGASDVDLDGFYAQIGYFLTGETRPYKASSGAFSRVIPNENYGPEGSGAWELAARFSNINLSDGALLGGEEDNITLAVNWYLNPNLRAGFNYVTGKVDLGGALDSEDVSAGLLRLQIEW